MFQLNKNKAILMLNIGNEYNQLIRVKGTSNMHDINASIEIYALYMGLFTFFLCFLNIGLL